MGERGMHVYLDVDGEKHLIGRADVPQDCGPVFEARLFGPTSIIVEPYTIGAVTKPSVGVAAPVVVTAVLLAPGQCPEFLPGWQPLAS
jgi:hypothetical protein